jgi:hypothetical protein
MNKTCWYWSRKRNFKAKLKIRMKKIYALIFVILISISSFAQRTGHKYARQVNSVSESTFSNNTYARTTHAGDTLKLSNIPAADTPFVIYAAGVDSGYLTGTDYWGDRAFAERYDFNGADSILTVIGVFAQFSGKVNAGSTKTVSFNVWNVNSPQYITAGLFYSGFPNTSLTTHSVPVTQLGIGSTKDTLKKFMFDSTATFSSGSLFVGYSINYNFNALAGDMIGLASSADGDRTSPKIKFDTMITDIDTTIDTLINVQNATQWSDGNWHDNYSDNDSISNDLAIFPIVVIWHGTSIKGVTRKGLTFYGNYPNPAVNSTTIKFSLADRSDVMLQITDMNGRIVNTLSERDLSAGEHVLQLNTSELPDGDYLYLIRTSTGDGIASKLTVIK